MSLRRRERALIRLRRGGRARVAAALLVLAPACASASPAGGAPALVAGRVADHAGLPTGYQGLRVSGNRLVFGPGAGTPVQIRGVARSGPEYASRHR